MSDFCHLHNHTQYSLLDGASKIDQIVERALADGQPAIAITDHGNMFGVPAFVQKCNKAGVKPIVGCEFYLAKHSLYQKHNKQQNPFYHQILWAKSRQGYQNLMKLSSIGFREGFHYKPRIDKQLLQQHKDGLVASTCCLASEINQTILNEGPEAAEQLFRWYLELFGEDYYIELQRHGLQLQERCNQVLMQWAERYGVPMIATNDIHYTDQQDSEAHDLLLALQTGKELDDENRLRFVDDQSRLNPNFYFKPQAEMKERFSDVPQAVENTLGLAEKCAFAPAFTGEMLLPTYQIPPEYEDMDAYLAALTWQRARERYGEISADLQQRIETELGIIKWMGYAGYFLIVQEFTTEARRRGVYVGPGRGSAAGSVVAYCNRIIDVDPMQHNLFFERFLNPERVNPPDIDIDFDDSGRDEVIDFVVEKYGRQSVSQIITYGTMGVKTALQDVGRVLKIPLNTVNYYKSLVPEKPGITFAEALDSNENPEGADLLNQAFNDEDENIRRMMQYARTLEGTPRQTGVHAAGVIIAPGELTDYVPVSVNRSGGNETVVTQFDGPSAEEAGLLKMDFLGLKTLSIIKSAIRAANANYDAGLDPDNIPLDDANTFELYRRGETVATFQFESEGMRKNLRQLQPSALEDLVAMNALYRPGPMDNIPAFINRKHGREQVTYPHELLQPILENTYGIMVYQEQIMEAAKVLAGYSLGEADILRRAMGKKKMEEMDKQREKFIRGAKEKNGIEQKQAEEIYDLMAKFAYYGFNKSHAVAYSLLAYRTAYLKANYPREFMAAVLSHNLEDIDKITFFISECRRMGIEVLPPSVNESQYLFAVNEEGQIRYGLGAIKGVGTAVAQAIIEERDGYTDEDGTPHEGGGDYESLFDLCARLPKQQLGRNTLMSLANAGAFDDFPKVHRAQYFQTVDNDGRTVLDRAVHYGQSVQEAQNSAQASLFGGGGGSGADIPVPPIPEAEPWSILEKLNRERDVIGFYLSGHPLDDYKLELQNFTTCRLNELEHYKDREVKLAGIVTHAQDRISQKGTRYGDYALEDFNGKISFRLFSDDYAQFKGFLEVNNCVFIRAKYQPSFRDPAQYELKVQEIKMLDRLLADTARQLVLELSLEQLNEGLLDDIEQALTNHPGKCSVKFRVKDADYEQPLTLHARSTMVTPAPALVEALEAAGVPFSIQ
jgi:DNA polymerase-3 subunit alpha